MLKFKLLIPSLSILLAFDATAQEPGDPSHRDVVKTDLFVVISLSGRHCEEVVDYEKMGEMNYIAICRNGARYRVNVTPEGRVETGLHEAP